MTDLTYRCSKSAALAAACSNISMYRQGSGWIVSSWDPSVSAHRLSHEMPHSTARQAVADGRLLEALCQMLGPDDGGRIAAARYDDYGGSLPDRLDRALYLHESRV